MHQLTQTPGSNRRHLGRELRHAREVADYTQGQVATLLKCGQSKIAKIEGEDVEIRPGELRALMDFYKLSDVKRQQLIEAHANCSMRRTMTNLPKRSKAFQMVLDLEGEASEILSWHSERIPGPLQSEAYMLTQLKLNKRVGSSYVTQLIRLRTARNGLFTADPAPCYQVILSESSLRRIPGGLEPSLALDQMEHLVTLMKKYPQLDLRLLTWEAKISVAVADFTVLKFRESTSDYIQPSDFAYVEYPGGGLTIDETGPFLESWDELLGAALTRAETLEVLTTRSGEIYDKLVNNSEE